MLYPTTQHVSIAIAKPQMMFVGSAINASADMKPTNINDSMMIDCVRVRPRNRITVAMQITNAVRPIAGELLWRVSIAGNAQDGIDRADIVSGAFLRAIKQETKGAGVAGIVAEDTAIYLRQPSENLSRAII